MDRSIVQRIADDFWEAVGEPEPFPRLLESAILWALPLAVFKLPRLWISDLQAWLAARKTRVHIQSDDRPLHGCLLAYGGYGCVLLNGSDSLDELRFSLAHEAAHFLLDYLRPRQHAVKRLGPQILDVFDGQRAPTVQERIHAILDNVPIGFHTHFMARSADGLMGCDVTSEIESDADVLALELLAPEREVRRRLASALRATPQQNTDEIATQLLLKDFGLPYTVAVAYARLLYPGWRSQTVREWLRQRDG